MAIFLGKGAIQSKAEEAQTMDLRANGHGPGIDINISHLLSNKEISQHVRKSQRLNFVSSRIKCVFLIYRFIAIKFDTKARQ